VYCDVHTQRRQHATISRDAAVGSVVARLRATDADSTRLNSRLSYDVAHDDDDDDDGDGGGGRRSFHVDRLTGVVTLAVPGHALRHAHYRLHVLVSDAGRPPLASSVRLTVDVTSPMTSSRAGGLVTSLVSGASVPLVVLVVVAAVAVGASLVAAIIAVLLRDRCVMGCRG